MRKVWRDPALDNKPPAPRHVFEAWFWGDQCCARCHRKISEIDARNLECVSDEHIEKAAKASAAFARVRR